MQNLLIKGNNLIVLHSLKHQFANKIKLIYIDPPYNTGNDGFKYNDKFNHSTWLTFMKNRLEIARELLAEDGVIFVQCDDNEQAYLKVLMDEVFGRENFVCNIIIQTSVSGGFKVVANKPVRVKEFIIYYSKNPEMYEYNKIYIRNPRKEWDMHNLYFYEREANRLYKLEDILLECKILAQGEKLKDIDINDKVFKEFYTKHDKNICSTSHYKESEEKTFSINNRDKVIKHSESIFLYNGRMLTFLSSSLKNINGEKEFALALSDIFTDISFNNVQNEVKEASFPSGKKPEALIQRIIEMSTKPGDIVLDFFAGSGTTGAVAHKMGRQWIMIEQMDYIETITKVRMQKVIEGEAGGVSKALNWSGGGSFVYLDWSVKKINPDQKIAKLEIQLDILNETLDFVEKNDNLFTSFLAMADGFKNKDELISSLKSKILRINKKLVEQHVF